MDENPQDVATDENVDVEETTNSNEDSEQENAVAEEEKEEVVPKKQYDQVFSRAKKAEADLKKLKEAKAEAPINRDPQLSDELKLIARGLSDEEIEQAKIIAKGKDIVLTEAIKDPMFLVYQRDFKEKERKEKARLGASRGSGESVDSTVIKGDMSREEHQKVFEKVMANVRT